MLTLTFDSASSFDFDLTRSDLDVGCGAPVTAGIESAKRGLRAGPGRWERALPGSVAEWEAWGLDRRRVGGIGRYSSCSLSSSLASFDELVAVENAVGPESEAGGCDEGVGASLSSLLALSALRASSSSELRVSISFESDSSESSLEESLSSSSSVPASGFQRG